MAPPDPPASPTYRLRYLALGALIVLPTGLIEARLGDGLAGHLPPGWPARLGEAFLVTALVEEAARLGAVRLAGQRLASAAERAAAGALIGLGFALFEGIFYLGSPAAALLRVGLSTPSHVLDGWIMGAGWARPATMLVACTLLHGLWDFGAFQVGDGAAWWGLAIPLALAGQFALAERVGGESGAPPPAMAPGSGFRMPLRMVGGLLLVAAGLALVGALEDGAGSPDFPSLVVGAALAAAIGTVALALAGPSPGQ